LDSDEGEIKCEDDNVELKMASKKKIDSKQKDYDSAEEIIKKNLKTQRKVFY